MFGCGLCTPEEELREIPAGGGLGDFCVTNVRIEDVLKNPQDCAQKVLAEATKGVKEKFAGVFDSTSSYHLGLLKSLEQEVGWNLDGENYCSLTPAEARECPERVRKFRIYDTLIESLVKLSKTILTYQVVSEKGEHLATIIPTLERPFEEALADKLGRSPDDVIFSSMSGDTFNENTEAVEEYNSLIIALCKIFGAKDRDSAYSALKEFGQKIPLDALERYLAHIESIRFAIDKFAIDGYQKWYLFYEVQMMWGSVHYIVKEKLRINWSEGQKILTLSSNLITRKHDTSLS